VNKIRLLLILLFTFFLIIFLFPEFSYLRNNQIIGDSGDNYEYFTFMYLAKSNIVKGIHPFSNSHFLRYPDGFEFGYGFDGFFSVILGGILGLFLNNTTAYNVVVFTILFINIIVSFKYFKNFNSTFFRAPYTNVTSYIASIIFAVSPYIISRLNGHLNLAFVAGFVPFFYYSLLVFYNALKNDKPIYKELLGVGLSLVVILMGSLQYLILLFWLFFWNLPLIILFQKNNIVRLLRRVFSKYSFFSLLFIILIIIGVFPGYIKGIVTNNINYTSKRNIILQPTDIIIPNNYLINSSTSCNANIENVSYIGYIELAFVFVFILGLISRRVYYLGKHISTIKLSTQFYMMLIWTFSLYQLVSAGYIKLPLYPEGGRAAVIGSLFSAVAFIIIIQKLNQHTRLYLPYLYIFIILGLFWERSRYNIYITTIPAYYQLKTISDTKTNAVLTIPLSFDQGYNSAISTIANKPVLDGYFHYPADTNKARSFIYSNPLVDLYCGFGTPKYTYNPSLNEDYYKTRANSIISIIKENQIDTAVVLKNNMLFSLQNRRCLSANTTWQYLQPYYQLTNSTDDIDIYQLK
jgi:hypothetical protein